jgi:hypothetical protein
MPGGSRCSDSSSPRPLPAEERATLRLAEPDLGIALVAAELEVISPVAIARDEAGGMFVAEMIDYPIGAKSGRVKRFEDRDGLYEGATVHAEGLSFPNGVLPYKGGVFVTAAPDLWYFKDTDAPATPPGKAVSIRRRDFPFRPSTVEAVAGFSQFGLPRDNWGDRFPSWNTVPWRHVVLEERTLARNPYLAEPGAVAEILDPADDNRLFAIGPPQTTFNRESVTTFNAGCGPTIYRGDLLGPDYRGNDRCTRGRLDSSRGTRPDLSRHARAPPRRRTPEARRRPPGQIGSARPSGGPAGLSGGADAPGRPPPRRRSVREELPVLPPATGARATRRPRPLGDRRPPGGRAPERHPRPESGRLAGLNCKRTAVPALVAGHEPGRHSTQP